MRGDGLQFKAAGVIAFALLGAGCTGDMRDQSYVEPLERSAFFKDGMGSRPKIAGTVSREEGRYETVQLSGRENGVLAERIPFQVTSELMRRGQAQYLVFCLPCHGTLGRGDGLVTQRGFPRPPSLGEQRLREAPDGHLFEVITKGYGVMYSYDGRIDPIDRWAIVAYLRALQLAETMAETEGGAR